jgi:transposase
MPSAISPTTPATANPWAADIYNRAIARKKDHPHAVRILARAWL